MKKVVLGFILGVVITIALFAMIFYSINIPYINKKDNIRATEFITKSKLDFQKNDLQSEFVSLCKAKSIQDDIYPTEKLAGKFMNLQKVWDIQNKKYSAVGLIRDEDELLVGTKSGELELIDIKDGSFIRKFDINLGCEITAITIGDNDDFLIGTEKGIGYIISTEGKCLNKIQIGNVPIIDIKQLDDYNIAWLKYYSIYNQQENKLNKKVIYITDEKGSVIKSLFDNNNVGLVMKNSFIKYNDGPSIKMPNLEKIKQDIIQIDNSLILNNLTINYLSKNKDQEPKEFIGKSEISRIDYNNENEELLLLEEKNERYEVSIKNKNKKVEIFSTDKYISIVKWISNSLIAVGTETELLLIDTNNKKIKQMPITSAITDLLIHRNQITVINEAEEIISIGIENNIKEFDTRNLYLKNENIVEFGLYKNWKLISDITLDSLKIRDNNKNKELIDIYFEKEELMDEIVNPNIIEYILISTVKISANMQYLSFIDLSHQIIIYDLNSNQIVKRINFDKYDLYFNGNDIYNWDYSDSILWFLSESGDLYSWSENGIQKSNKKNIYKYLKNSELDIELYIEDSTNDLFLIKNKIKTKLASSIDDVYFLEGKILYTKGGNIYLFENSKSKILYSGLAEINNLIYSKKNNMLITFDFQEIKFIDTNNSKVLMNLKAEPNSLFNPSENKINNSIHFIENDKIFEINLDIVKVVSQLIISAEKYNELNTLAIIMTNIDRPKNELSKETLDYLIEYKKLRNTLLFQR